MRDAMFLESVAKGESRFTTLVVESFHLRMPLVVARFCSGNNRPVTPDNRAYVVKAAMECAETVAVIVELLCAVSALTPDVTHCKPIRKDSLDIVWARSDAIQREKVRIIHSVPSGWVHALIHLSQQ